MYERVGNEIFFVLVAQGIRMLSFSSFGFPGGGGLRDLWVLQDCCVQVHRVQYFCVPAHRDLFLE